MNAPSMRRASSESIASLAFVRWTIERGRALAAVAAMVVTIGALAACGSSSDAPTGTSQPPPQATSPTGNYNIATINAKALPVAVIADSGFTWEVTAGSMSLTADGKYTAVETYRQTVPGNVSVFVDSTQGTWALAGTTITFNNTLDQSTFQAAWSTSGTLTLQELDGKNSNTFVYAIAK